MKTLVVWDNDILMGKIISILDVQKPRSYDSFTDVYLIQVNQRTSNFNP